MLRLEQFTATDDRGASYQMKVRDLGAAASAGRRIPAGSFVAG